MGLYLSVYEQTGLFRLRQVCRLERNVPAGRRRHPDQDLYRCKGPPAVGCAGQCVAVLHLTIRQHD